MDHPEGAGLQRADRVDFDPRVRLEFKGTQLSSDGGLLVMRELDDTLGLSDLASATLSDTRLGKNTVHRLERSIRRAEKRLRRHGMTPSLGPETPTTGRLRQAKQGPERGNA